MAKIFLMMFLFFSVCSCNEEKSRQDKILEDFKKVNEDLQKSNLRIDSLNRDLNKKLQKKL